MYKEREKLPATGELYKFKKTKDPRGVGKLYIYKKEA
jgi:hypothetical protein